MVLATLLRPRSIAVVGASPRSFIGQVVVRNCLARGFSGPVVPVTDRHSEVAGVAAVRSLSATAEVADVAVVQVRAAQVLPVVAAGLEAGVRGFVIPGAGYTDSGSEALALVKGLEDLRRHYDFHVAGPNCMGVLDLVTGAAPYIGSVTADVRSGTVAVITQSGAVAEAFVNCGGRVPLSTVVSSGSETVTGLADYLEFFAGDPATTAVLAFVETMTDPARTLAAAQGVTNAGKALAVCVVGRSNNAAEGVAAHSGRLAAGARLMTAALRQVGALIAADLDELMALGELLGCGRQPPAGARAHVVTNSGGEGNLIADIAHDAGLQLPAVSEATRRELQKQWPRLTVRNPLDPWGADDYTIVYPQALARAAGEDGDIVVVAMDQHRASGDHERQLGLDLARYLNDACAGSGKFPVLLSPVSDEIDPALVRYCRDASIALMRGARPALTALAALAARTRASEPPGTPAGSSPMVPRTGIPALPPRRVVTDHEALNLLAALGVATPRTVLAASPGEAASAARRLSPFVVLKGIAEDVVHKTDRGLVAISPVDVGEVAAQMQARNPDLPLRFLVAEQIRGDLEVIVGYKRDAVFGPVVMVGIGGVWAEFHDEVAIHVGLVDAAAAEQLLDESSVGARMADARGGPLDRAGVLAALRAVSDLAAAYPDVVSIDVNPLIVSRTGATAVDAVIETRLPAGQPGSCSLHGHTSQDLTERKRGYR